MKAIKFYLKATVIAALISLSPWLAAMFVDMRLIKWWHDEGSRVCTATAEVNPQNHDAAPIVDVSWRYGIHDYSGLRLFIIIVFMIVMAIAVCVRGHKEHGWFQ